MTRPDFTSENFEVGNPLERELAHFVKCIDAHAAGLLEEIVNIGKEEPETTRVCEKAVEAALSGKEVSLE